MSLKSVLMIPSKVRPFQQNTFIVRSSRDAKVKCWKMAEISSGESYRLEGIAFGLADGLIMCLGLIIGVAEATFNTRLVITAGVIGGFANAFGNSIGFFMSQSAERALQIRTANNGVNTRIHSRKEIFTNTALAFTSTIGVSLILLCPFVYFVMDQAMILTFIVGAGIAFALGSYVGKISHENPYKAGLKYTLLAIAGAVISHLIADLTQILN